MRRFYELAEKDDDDDDDDKDENEDENATLLRNGFAFKQVLEKIDVQEIAKPLRDPQTVIIYTFKLIIR